MNEDKHDSPTPEAPAPTWLNAELIQTALRNDGDTDCVVMSVSTDRAMAPGDNYLSVIYRVKAQLADGSERIVVVKAQPDGDELVSYLEESGTFEREGEILGDIIPRMQALLEKGSPGRWKPMAARCPFRGSRPGFLVLEDLGQKGFRMANRLRGLGLRHCLVALRTLARYHASSHALLKEDPILRERFGTKEHNPLVNLGTFITAGVQGAADACRGWPGFEEYADSLEKLKLVYLDKYREFGNPNPKSFNVISHGDFWTNNMMFSYDEDGLPCDHRVVDLQIALVTSPALDVIYFLCTSPSDTVANNEEDLLIREYHFALQEALAALGMKGPTLDEFHVDMKTHGIYCLFAVFAAIPLIKSEKVGDLDGAMAGDKESIRILYTRPLVKKWVQRILPGLKRKGWLDA